MAGGSMIACALEVDTETDDFRGDRVNIKKK